MFNNLFNQKQITKAANKLGAAINNLVGTIKTGSIFSNFSFTGNNSAYYKDWVYRAIKVRAERVADIDFNVYDLKGNKVLEHEIFDFLESLDYEAISSFLDLYGNAFVYIARYGNEETGLPAVGFVINPNIVKMTLDEQDQTKIKNYSIGGQTISANNIIHIKNFNPNNNYPYPGFGLSIIEGIISSVQSNDAARLWNYNFFKNAARPSGVLSTDQLLNEEEIRSSTDDFLNKYGSVKNAHKLALLSGGFKFTQLSINQKDMDFVEQSKMSMEEILSAFGVPKSEIGLMENIQRANAETSSYVFTKNTIMPIMKKIAKSISKAILKDYKDLSYIEAVNIVPDNKEQLLAEWTVGVDKWITRNEIRNHLGLPLIQGGDTLYSEFNKVEIDSQIKTVKSNNKLESKQNNNFVIESVFNKLNKALEYKKLAKENIKEVNIKTWEVIFKKYEPELINSIQKYFKDQEKALLKKISGKKSISINKVKDLLNGNWYDSQISLGISFITPKLMEYILSGEKQGNDLLGTEDSISNSKIESFVKSRAEYFSNSINNTTKENLINSIAEGIGKGENDSKIIDRVKTIYTIATDSRSKMIARTEISASANYGKIELFKTAGVESLEWVVVNPEDDDCFENEGVVINIGDNFPSGISAPPVHPNCMCSINPVFNTEE